MAAAFSARDCEIRSDSLWIWPLFFFHASATAVTSCRKRARG